ncbi:MAG: V-type ATP synthase subunit B, partial [Promethearchaeota archaeon]
MSIIYKNIKQIIGPLIFLENNHSVQYGEIVEIHTVGQENRIGQVVKIDEDLIIVEVFEDTKGMSSENSTIFFTGDSFKLKISNDMFGGIFNSLGKQIDIYT